MAVLTVEVGFLSGTSDLGRERLSIDLPGEAQQEGVHYFLQEAVAHIKQELLYGEYTEDIPVPEDLSPRPASGKWTFTIEDTITGRYDDVMNTVELWRLAFNVILDVRFWLAKAKAYFEVWKAIDPSDERLRAIIHEEKMEKFNLAAYGIAKLRDLHVRIISEALGHRIFDADFDKENWEESINVRRLQDALRKRDKYEDLRMMTDVDFTALTEVAERLKRKYDDATMGFLEYRNKLAHGNPASVDDSRYFPQLKGRQWTPIVVPGEDHPRGWTKASGVGFGPPDWTSDVLYDLLVKALKHYIETLRKLKAIPIFGPV